MASSKHEFSCIPVVAVHVDTISLVWAVSEQILFLSNLYDVHNAQICTNLICTRHDAYFTS